MSEGYIRSGEGVEKFAHALNNVMNGGSYCCFVTTTRSQVRVWEDFLRASVDGAGLCVPEDLYPDIMKGNDHRLVLWRRLNLGLWQFDDQGLLLIVPGNAEMSPCSAYLDPAIVKVSVAHSAVAHEKGLTPGPWRDDVGAFLKWRWEVDQDHCLDTFDLALAWFSGKGHTHDDALMAAEMIRDIGPGGAQGGA